MDSPSEILVTSKESRKRQKRREKKRRAKNRSRSPARHLGLVSERTLKNKLKNIKIPSHRLESIVRDLCADMNVDSQESASESERFEVTAEFRGDSVDHIPPDKPNEVITIDLSDDLPKQKEVIDLTESFSALEDIPQRKAIDISDEKAREECKVECRHDEEPKEAAGDTSDIDNDEISVIGTFPKTSNFIKKPSPFISASDKWNNLITCSESLKRKYLKKHSVLDNICKKPNRPKKVGRNLEKTRKDSNKIADTKVDKKLVQMQKDSNKIKIGGNVYVNSPEPLPSDGLRPIIIDGNNVAYVHSNCNFSSKRLEICINYFKERGHKVTAFVPQFRLSNNKNDDPELLRKLEKQGDVVLTPSKRIDGRSIVPYDDRFIVQTAVLKGGIIVTRDNYKDLLEENPAWAETIKYRTLAFTWVDDVLMFPKDPLGELGPSLEQFLKFH